MKYTAKFFSDTMPQWKKEKDSVVARIIHRPISFYFSSFFSNIGITSNQVSGISLIVSIIACIYFFMVNEKYLLWGAILMNLWSILDSADGNMARSLGGKKYGGFIDALSSYVLVGFYLTGLGYSVFITGGLLIKAGEVKIVLIGALASAFDTMARLFFQKLKNEGTDDDLNDETGQGSLINRIQTRIQSEFGLGGWNMIMIFAAIYFHAIDVYVLFYFIYYGFFLIFSTAYLIYKTGCLKN